MPGDLWLKIDGIKGEATDDGHKDEIDIDEWSWAMTHPVEIRGGGMSGGETSVDTLLVRKSIDKASPNLMKYCLSAKTMDKVLLTMRKRGDKPIDFVKITLKNAVVAGVETSGQEDDAPRGTPGSRSDSPRGPSRIKLSEKVRFAFDAVEFEYTPQKPDGQPDGAVSLSWNIKANKEG
jgi:type VI secretion system secreted protein Hcp